MYLTVSRWVLKASVWLRQKCLWTLLGHSQIFTDDRLPQDKLWACLASSGETLHAHNQRERVSDDGNLMLWHWVKAESTKIQKIASERSSSFCSFWESWVRFHFHKAGVKHTRLSIWPASRIAALSPALLFWRKPSLQCGRIIRKKRRWRLTGPRRLRRAQRDSTRSRLLPKLLCSKQNSL